MRTQQRHRLGIEQLEARDNPSSVLPLQGDLAGTFNFASATASYSGNLSHLGTYQGGLQVLSSSPGSLTTSGKFVAANGDTLTKQSVITLVPTATPGVDAFTDAVTITGGTGRFAGDTGDVIITGQVNLSTGAFSGEIAGRLFRPGK
jgi:hypothetical protein